MDYIVNPVLSVCGQWFSSHIYQPCYSFAKSIFCNAPEVAPELCYVDQEHDTSQDISLAESSPVFLPSGCSLTASDKQTMKKPTSIPNVKPSQKPK